MSREHMPRLPYDADRTYHGVPEDEAPSVGKIWVELSEFGPTERKGAYVLRELAHPEQDVSHLPHPYAWGYYGTGPLNAAETILADAMGVPPSVELRNAFGLDVMAHIARGEWRLRRGAVLRWVRGWCAEHEFDGPSEAMRNLPPVDMDPYESAPEHIREIRERRLAGEDI